MKPLIKFKKGRWRVYQGSISPQQYNSMIVLANLHDTYTYVEKLNNRLRRRSYPKLHRKF